MKIEDILLNEKEVMSLQDMRSTSLGAIGHDKIVAATQLRKALIMLDNGRHCRFCWQELGENARREDEQRT